MGGPRAVVARKAGPGSRGSARWSSLWCTGAAVVTTAALALSGCSFISGGPEYGPDDYPAIANGLDAHIGTVEIRSFLIVSTGEGEPGRFLGTVFNDSGDPATVTFADDDEEVTVTVSGGESRDFSEDPEGLETVGENPGSLVPMTVSVGSETEEILPIILDGSLEQYRQYLPSGNVSQEQDAEGFRPVARARLAESRTTIGCVPCSTKDARRAMWEMGPVSSSRPRASSRQM